MFLFNRTVQWVHVTKDEMQFMVVATFIRTKHNRVRRFVVELQNTKEFSLKKKIQSESRHRQITVLRSVVSGPEDNNLMYEPPHS